MTELQELAEMLELGSHHPATALTARLLADNVAAGTILHEGLIAGMAVVGEKMRKGEMYLPEVLQSARVMQACMNLLKPHLLEAGVEPVGRIVLGTVKGDMHDIGKNLVAIMLQGAGLEIIDLGINTTPDKIVEAIRTHQPAFVGLSAMLTTTMLGMKRTIEAIAAAGLRSQVKIIIGGAPVTQRFAEEIGADGYGRDAVSAVELVKALMNTSPAH